MAVIYDTTMMPSKLELLAWWLPTQPWYRGAGRTPELAKVGGFRLDDPDGEVGIEFMVVTDRSADRPVAYLVPLSYRGAPLAAADDAFVGAAEHGVLGRRWIYDGARDPVLVAALLALLQGKAEPQAQSESSTPDPSVACSFSGTDRSSAVGSTVVANGADGTEILVTTADTAASGNRQLTIRVTRVLRPVRVDGSTPGTPSVGHVTAGWRLANGSTVRGQFANLREVAPE